MFSVSLLILASVVTAATPAGPVATAEQARASVQRSLPYLENVSTAWMRERKCNSCHNVTFLIWAHNEAAAHGLRVDQQKLAEWTKWSLADTLAERHWFRLRPRSMQALKAAGLSAELLAKLKPQVGQTYVTQKDFLDALGKILSADELARHRGLLLSQFALPNNGVAADTLTQHLLSRAGRPEDPATANSYRSVRSMLLEWQGPDGAWEADGQLPGLKWKPKEMNEATTLWSLLALSTTAAKDEPLDAARRRALESLKGTEPGITLQSLALHLVAAQKFGQPASAAQLSKDLLARQNADGGWSWVRENKSSDAFATGQALYALGLLGRDGRDSVVQQAWSFLVRTQGHDGGWDVPQEAINIRPRKLNVYPYWGTAWSAIGLLQTLPRDGLSTQGARQAEKSPAANGAVARHD